MLLRHWRRRIAHSRILVLFAVLGPGIVAASAGNDAGGVATYSQAGAQYGYSLLWVLLLLTFSLAIAQEMGARMATVTGKGLADLVREEFGVKVTLFAMIALVIANVATTIAEFAGIAAVIEMFLPRSTKYYLVPLLAVALWFLVARGTYKRVERIFLAMCLIYLTYVVSAFLAHPPWGTVVKNLVVPDMPRQGLGHGYLQMVIALVGTTIAPWMQFYVQSSVRDKGIKLKDYSLERIDVLSGAVLSNLISFFIVVTCAATLWAGGYVVSSGFDANVAARALEPVAGSAAKVLFAIGLFNAAMVGAVAVPLSTAYAVTEALGWESGLGRRIREAPLFIGVYTAVLILATAVVLTPGIHLFKVILTAQIINGVLLPVILVLMLILVNKRRLMGSYVNGRIYNALAWATVVAVASLSIAYLVQSV